MVVPTATTRRPSAARAIDRLGRRRRDLGDLRLEPVLLDLGRADRPEGPGAHVEGHAMDLDTRRAQALEQRRGEVQPGSGRGHRALRRRVDRLVALAVLRLGRVVPLDIGRQRRQAVALEQLVDRPRRLDLDHARAQGAVLEHRGARRAAPPADARAEAAALPRAHQRLPALAVERAEHQELHRPAVSFEGAEEPRRDHPALVDDHAVARPEPARQIARSAHPPASPARGPARAAARRPAAQRAPARSAAAGSS